jgi:hypothetical protein
MNEPTDNQCDPRHYEDIALILFASFAICMGGILAMNLDSVETWLAGIMGYRKSFVLQLYFWASLGATVASYKFFAEDKELNEVECLKDKPDPLILRYPNGLDVTLYMQRILFGGVHGVIGAIIVFASSSSFGSGLGLLDSKHRLTLILLCFLIGFYQDDFFKMLGRLKRIMFSWMHAWRKPK